MQTSRPRSGSSEMGQKTSPSASKTTKLFASSSESSISKPSKPLERRFSSKTASSPEKRIVRVSEMQQQLGQVQEDLKKAKEEKSQAVEELKEAKKMLAQGGGNDSKSRIMMLQADVAKAKDSERKMLESMVSQTKQLEETKIELEEAKLEIRALKESFKGIEKSTNHSSRNLERHLEGPNNSDFIRSHEEIGRLKNELKLATEAEEKSKEAMDNLALALKEVTTEANQVKEKLSVIQSESQIDRAEANRAKEISKSTEQKYQKLLEAHERLKFEVEELLTTWNEKENGFIDCMKASEEEIAKLKQENDKLVDAQRMAREDNSRLRDIMKQALNEATVVKEALEIARSENSQLKDNLSDKDNALQRTQQEYESLKVSEAAALDSLKELKRLLGATPTSSPALDPGKSLNLSETGSFVGKPKAIEKEVRDSRSAMKFPSDRWVGDNKRIQNGHKDSRAGSGSFRRSVFDTNWSPEKNNRMYGSVSNLSELKVPSSLVTENGDAVDSDGFDHLDGLHFDVVENGRVSLAKQKSKKTMFRRFGEMLSRRSFRK